MRSVQPIVLSALLVLIILAILPSFLNCLPLDELKYDDDGDVIMEDAFDSAGDEHYPRLEGEFNLNDEADTSLGL